MAEWVLKDAEAVREELTKEQEDEISLLYRKVYLQVKHELDITPANGTATQHLQRQRLWQIKRQLDEAYKSLGIGLEKSIAKEAKKAAQGVVDDINAKTSKLGLKIEGAYAYVPTEIVNAIASGKVYDGSWSLSGAIWRDIDKHQSDINKIIAEGVAANKSAYDIAKDLEKYVNPSAKKDWEWSKVYPGTSKKVDYNAQRLARTMVSHAYQQSLERVCKNNPFVDGYIWRASGTHTCPLCEERDGQLYEKGNLPLDHPNGMCTFIAHIPNNMKEVADRLADWAKGGNDPELTKWYESMLGGTYENKKVFNDLQNKWLSKNGFTPDNMPASFSDWSYSLTSSQKQELFDMLNLHGVDHPFQELEKWYNANLTEVKTESVFIPRKSTNNLGGAYTQARKDAAMWAQSSEEADKKLRAKSGEVWKGATDAERRAIFGYTEGSGAYNRPLRGYDGSWRNFVGVGKVSLDNEGKGQAIVEATQIISKSMYDFDAWFQRGVDTKGLASFLGVERTDLIFKSEEELKSMLLGKVVKDEAFTSCGTAKGTGFSGQIINVYAPAGTRMMYAEPFSEFGFGGGVNWDGESGQSIFGQESEIILQRGTSFRITKVEKGEDRFYIDVEVVGQDY